MEKSLSDQLELIERIVGKGKGALNTSEVASILGVSSSTIDGWRKQGIGIGYVKLGSKSENNKNRVLYPTIEVAKWIIKNSINTA